MGLVNLHHEFMGQYLCLSIWEFGAVKETSFNFYFHIFDRNVPFFSTCHIPCHIVAIAIVYHSTSSAFLLLS